VIKPPDFENIWEAIQLVTGDTYIYHKGFKEEADVKDIFKFNAGYDNAGKIIYQFSRFDFNPAKPDNGGTIRLNRSVITFAWYIDPHSDIISKLKDAMAQMDAKRAGLILPNLRAG
jgi:hypothetical protein